MTGARTQLVGIFRAGLAGVLILQLLLLERGTLTGARFHAVRGLGLFVAVAAAVIFPAAVAILLRKWRPGSRAISVLVVGLAIALTVRFDLAPFLDHTRDPSLAAQKSEELVSFLRKLASAQEQYRLRSGRYSDSMDPLRKWADQPAGTTVKLVPRDDIGWSGQVSLAGLTCSIWVRDSALRSHPWQPEGSPTCGLPERRMIHEAVPSVLVPSSREVTTFDEADVFGTWLQHRADVHRTAVSAADSGVSGHRWTTRVGGPLRASVSIAGNQVFVGAHGNGEVVAMSLDSGKVGFRLRAPNWVHHEPAVSRDLFIVGFGNNELEKKTSLGTDPSGVVAYDRRTGFERWRLYTKGTVMSVPVIADSVVAVSTGEPEVVGMRLRDGIELWRTAVPAYTPMGNPLLVDSLMIFGVEGMKACAINVHAGALAYCTVLFDCVHYCWGAGHSSPALAGDIVLQVMEEDTWISRPLDAMISFARKVVGLPSKWRDADFGDQILVAFDWRDGRVRWRTSIGKGPVFSAGHTAGTPTLVDSVAYIPAASDGHVVAVNTKSGRVLWSTPVRSARGSVNAIRGSVFAATLDTTFVVLDAANGRVTCRQRLPARADRAGLTIAGETGILTLGNGTVMARPLSDWLACHS